MSPRTLLITLVLTTTLFVASSAWTGAQAPVATTSWEVESAAPGVEAWDGGAVSGTVGLALCYSEGGVNPLGGGFIVDAAVTAPSWVTASVSPAQTSIVPPAGPTTEPGCESPVTFTVQLQAPEGVQFSQTATVSVSFTLTVETEETTGIPLTGTFDSPGDTSGSFAVRARDAPPAQDPAQAAMPEDPNGSPRVEPQTDDQEAPAVPVLLVIGALGLLVFGRRRS
jgi:hypothetical protein